MRTTTARVQHQLHHLINVQRRICVSCFHIAKITESPGSERVSHTFVRRNGQRLATIVEENSENTTPSAFSPLREPCSGESENPGERPDVPFSLNRVKSLELQ
jgi:hypothetical protein